MVFFNYATKEITAKIVYYGPGLSGKTTNLQHIYKSLPAEDKGKMISLATSDDRTLFFDFLPIELGTIRGMRTRIQLYTVPGQVFYNTTRKLVLKGADAVVFVADSQKEMMEHNVESFVNLQKNLKEQGLNLQAMPHILQYNKRDLTNIESIAELNKRLNKYNVANFEAIATKGFGVYECLREIIRQVINKIAKEYGEKAEKKPPIAPPTKAEEEIPSAVPVAKPEAAEEPIIGLPSDRKEELFPSEEQVEEEMEESWMQELEAGDLEPKAQKEEAPLPQELGKQEPPLSPIEESFPKGEELELEEKYTAFNNRETEQEISLPLRINIDRESDIVKLKIILNIKLIKE